MKLKITDYFWAVGCRTKKVKTVYAPLKVGPIPAMGEVTRWQIDEVGDGFAKLSVIRHDGATIRTFTVEKGKEAGWYPRSMDAGHRYTMKLVRFF
ncbi:MAG: hypothetical protein IKM00_02995 [Clostridia bacterium]|nr:hypothetical protein [Clostridia bacterium]MBR6744167.1 hypothetical protein [Clostridia bacterium]